MLARNSTSWLALPYWGGMGEALFFSRSKAVSLAITQREDGEGGESSLSRARKHFLA